MYILLTNDDGIHAAGIKALSSHLAKAHEILVVAPRSEMSGVSHSCTIFTPLFVSPFEIAPGVTAHAVEGTPSDCVKLGVARLASRKPDLIISGFNDGDNSGISSFYSGTVAGAREGLFFGIPSLSLSLCKNTPAHVTFALSWLDRFLGMVMGGSLRLDAAAMLNVNFPACPPDRAKGTRLVRQGLTPFRDEYEERVNPSGQKYYWLHGDRPASACPNDDLTALSDRFVTVTPLSIDMTDERFLKAHSKTFQDL